MIIGIMEFMVRCIERSLCIDVKRGINMLFVSGAAGYKKGSLVIVVQGRSGRQVAALLGVLEPKLVLGQHVLCAELAALPVDSLLQPAEVPADMLIALIKLDGQSALPAGGEEVRVIAVVEEVFGELADIEEAAASLAAGQQLALLEVVLTDVLEGLVAVLAVLVLRLLLLLLLCRALEGLLVDGLLAV